MAGPTTEVLNEDIRDIRSDMATMRADVHAISVNVAEFKAEVRVFMRLVTWAGALAVATLLTGGVSAVWWASGITAEVRYLGVSANKVEAGVTKLDGRLSAIESRLTAIDARLSSVEGRLPDSRREAVRPGAE